MCNLYSMTTTQEAMRRLARVVRDSLGNLPSLPGIFPDQLAPVVRVGKDGERALEMMRWGFPPASTPLRPPSAETQDATGQQGRVHKAKVKLSPRHSPKTVRIAVCSISASVILGSDMAKTPKSEKDVWREAILKRMLETPPKPFTPKPKTRPASKGRVHKGKTRA
jgi:hypothetical protein